MTVHVRLLADAPEGGPGNVVSVSRGRAADLVNAGLATRVAEPVAVVVPVVPVEPARRRPRAGR